MTAARSRPRAHPAAASVSSACESALSPPEAASVRGTARKAALPSRPNSPSASDQRVFSMTIRVLIADDQALLRATFRVLIDSCDDLEVVDEATDGQQAITLAGIHRPDVVLMDIRMPGTDGLAATAAICAQPALQATRVLILTTFQTDEHVAQALRLGASGFLGKNTTADAFLDGIRTVASGDALLSPLATRSLITRFLATAAPSESAPDS